MSPASSFFSLKAIRPILLLPGGARSPWRKVVLLLAILSVGLCVGGEVPCRPGSPTTDPTEIERGPGKVEASSTEPEWATGPLVSTDLLDGIGYWGRFRESWDTALLLRPETSRFFMYVRDGIPKKQLTAHPALNQGFLLEDLMAGRMIREREGCIQPAFPIAEGEARQAFQDLVDRTAHRIYPRLEKRLKKIHTMAENREHLPWLHTLVWAELLGSRQVEAALARANAMDSERLRNQGYLWGLAPGDPFFTGVERYGSGSWTLHYVWSNLALPNAVLRPIRVRQTLLDRAVDGDPWDFPRGEEPVAGLGVLDEQSKVLIPVLTEEDQLLKALRSASKVYAKRLIKELDIAPLAERLEVAPDEAFAMAFVSVGGAISRLADEKGVIPRTPYLTSQQHPIQELYTTLVVTEEPAPDPLEHSYYLYDRGEYEASILEAERFLATHPHDAEGVFRKGMALMKLRRYEKALATFEASIRTPTSSGDIWRGWILLRAGNILDVLARREEALEYYRQALTYSAVAGSHQLARQWLEAAYRE